MGGCGPRSRWPHTATIPVGQHVHTQVCCGRGSPAALHTCCRPGGFVARLITRETPRVIVDVMRVTALIRFGGAVDVQHTTRNGLPFKCFRERNRQSHCGKVLLTSAYGSRKLSIPPLAAYPPSIPSPFQQIRTGWVFGPISRVTSDRNTSSSCPFEVDPSISSGYMV